MTPAQIAALRDMALTITQPMQDYLLQDICRRVAKAGKMTSTAEYQIYRAQALGLAKKTIAKAIADQTELSNSEIDRIFDMVADTEIASEDNGSLQQMVAAYAGTAKRAAAASLTDMQMVTPDNNVKSMMDVYGESMDFAFKQVSTGAADYTTALRQATKNLAARGIREIMQSDGRSVGIEFATRRTLLNQLGLMDEKITQANHDELGCDGWEISAHAGCAPDHEDIQGRQFSDKEYKLLNSRLQRRIGTLSCKHWAAPIILGVNEPQYTEKQLQQFKDQNAQGVTYQGRHYTLYEASQKQAEIESGIRRMKNQCLADETLGDKEKLQTDQIRLVRLREEYVRFCHAAGQPTQSERLQVAGFGHSQAGKAVAASKSMFANLENRATMKAISGARITNCEGKAARAHAERYYGLVRSMRTDVAAIAKTTGISEAEIQRIKNFVFLEKHDLGRNEPEYFLPDFAMAQSWQRLISGRAEPHDLTLLQHEIMEYGLIDQGLTQDAAHRITSKKYNYQKEAEEYYASLKKHRNK